MASTFKLQNPNIKLELSYVITALIDFPECYYLFEAFLSLSKLKQLTHLYSKSQL